MRACKPSISFCKEDIWSLREAMLSFNWEFRFANLVLSSLNTEVSCCDCKRYLFATHPCRIKKPAMIIKIFFIIVFDYLPLVKIMPTKVMIRAFRKIHYRYKSFVLNIDNFLF